VGFVLREIAKEKIGKNNAKCSTALRGKKKEEKGKR